MSAQKSYQKTYIAYFCSKTVREMEGTFLNARLTWKLRSCSYASFYGDLHQAFEDKAVLLEGKVQDVVLGSLVP